MFDLLYYNVKDYTNIKYNLLSFNNNILNNIFQISNKLFFQKMILFQFFLCLNNYYYLNVKFKYLLTKIYLFI